MCDRIISNIAKRSPAGEMNPAGLRFFVQLVDVDGVEDLNR